MFFRQVPKAEGVARSTRRGSSAQAAIGLIDLVTRQIQTFGFKSDYRHQPPERKLDSLSNDMSRPMYRGESDNLLEDLNHRNYWVQFSPSSAITRTERVMIVGTVACEKVLAVAKHLAACEAAVDLCDDMDAALATVAQNPTRWCALIVYYSPSCKIADIVDDLRTLRIKAPSVPIMLIGQQTYHDNLCNGLTDVADIALYEPVQLSWFQEYLRLAQSDCLERCRLVRGQTQGPTRCQKTF